MFKSFLLLSAATLAIAQSSNTALEIEAIQAHFTNAGLVPDLLSTFDPSALMSVSFDGSSTIQPGQAFTSTEQVAPQPTVTITPANSSVSLGDTFTILMVDADIVGTDQSGGETRHWLLNGVTLSGSTENGNETVSNSSATSITAYAGPGPAEGSGAHRYVILLYTQPSSFSSPSDLSENAGVAKFSLADYVQSTGLQGPIAGTYFTVEIGTATASVSATSAVVTSTLPVPSSTSGSGSTGSSTGSSDSATETSNGATSIISHGFNSYFIAFASSVLAALAFA
ncbi:phosphatidylethanolamine binding protein [Pyrrhoderma noxium]|uniref:Phosphatidylethanolamine binding protein n=1 Tax=Pyrrhoderma noxium TaxID=2282107 RepID=A0A286UYA0_9AGAM|nr:phosphatidylethanolamine binding protein [Pyrrhoderma noxium]